MNNTQITTHSVNINRTQEYFNNFQMFSSIRNTDYTIDSYLNLYDKQKREVNSIYSNLNESESLDSEGKELLTLLIQKFSPQIKYIINNQYNLNEKITNDFKYLKDNNLNIINIKTYQNYIDNLEQQYNLITSKNNIVKIIIKDHSINKINISDDKFLYLEHLNNLKILLSNLMEMIKIKRKTNFWSIKNNINPILINNKYVENFPLIKENGNIKKKKNIIYENNYNFTSYSDIISVVTDIYISKENKLHMVINGIVYSSNTYFYIVDHRHLYEIKNLDLKELIIDKINSSSIPSIFSLENSSVDDISSINIKKLYRVHWNNFPGEYNSMNNKFIFMPPENKFGIYNNSFYKGMINATICKRNISVSVCTGIITSIYRHKTSNDLIKARITYNTHGQVKKNKMSIDEPDFYYNINKWVMCTLPIKNDPKIGDSVIVINSIFQKKKNCSKEIQFNTQICSSVSTIGLINVTQTTEKAKLIHDSTIYVPNFNQNIICSFKPFIIKKIVDGTLYIDISTVDELNHKEWFINTKTWKRQPFNVNDTINISFTKSKNGKLMSQIQNRGF